MTPIEVRRKRNQCFVSIPCELARDGTLSDKGMRLWIVLQSYADWTDRDCFPSHATLANDMGCTDRTVRRAIEELEDRGLLEITSGKTAGKSNIYTVCDPDEGRTPMSYLPGKGSDTHVRGGRTPMSDRGRTPMSYEQEPVEQDPLTLIQVASRDETLKFDDFWQVYPMRNGRRLYRGQAEALWKTLTPSEHQAAFRGAMNYKIDVDMGHQIAKDPHRWLRDKLWTDWQEPPDTGGGALVPRGRTPNGPRDPRRRGGTSLAAQAQALAEKELQPQMALMR